MMIQQATNSEPVLNGNGRAPARPRKISAGRGEAEAVAARLLAVLRSVFMPVDDQVEEMPLAQLRVGTLLFDEPRSMSALSKELGISLSAMTQLADRMQRARLVKRVFEGSDRRVRCLQLTPRALKIIRDRENARVQQISVVLARLSAETRQQILTNLEHLLSACVATKDERRRLSQIKRNGFARNGQRRELDPVHPLES